MKCKKCYSINEETIATISRLSAQKGIPESVIVNKFLDKDISMSPELTSAERYHFQRNSINLALDNVLLLFGIHGVDGGLTEKFRASLYIAHGNSKAHNREYRNGIIELSLFEILEQIKDLDINIWKNLTTIMADFGQMRSRYFNLYPKLKKGEKKEDTINNNTSIDSIIKRKEQRKENNSENNSVTELKEPESSNLSDDSLLNKIRKNHPDINEIDQSVIDLYKFDPNA